MSQGITGIPLDANFSGIPIFASDVKELYALPKSTTPRLSGLFSSSLRILSPSSLRVIVVCLIFSTALI